MALVVLMGLPIVLAVVAAVQARWGLRLLAVVVVMGVQVCRRRFQARLLRTVAVAVAAALVAFPVVLEVLAVVARKKQVVV